VGVWLIRGVWGMDSDTQLGCFLLGERIGSSFP
jgi:hypothetical protein